MAGTMRLTFILVVLSVAVLYNTPLVQGKVFSECQMQLKEFDFEEVVAFQKAIFLFSILGLFLVSAEVTN